jgi:hypothetical protein
LSIERYGNLGAEGALREAMQFPESVMASCATAEPIIAEASW